MPLRCTLRPNRSRPRLFTQRKAIEIACIAISNGASATAIHAGIEECAGRAKRPDSEAAEALAVAAQAIEASNAVIDADARSLNQFLNLPLAAAIFLRVIQRLPVVGPVLAVGIPALRELATARLAQIAVQKSANDAALVIVRRAAANEARFLRTGSGI